MRAARAQSWRRCARSPASRNPPPFAGREFTRTDRLFIRFAVYGECRKAGGGVARTC